MTTRDTILRSALELFAARGYDAVGVQEIAETAQVTKPSLYHYFGSKAGLLAALLATYHGELDQAVAQAANYGGDLSGSLQRIALAYFDFAQRHPVYYRLMLSLVFAPRQSEAYQAVAAYNQRQYEAVEAMFAAAAIQHGNMAGRQRLNAAAFIGLVNTSIGLWLNGHTELDDKFLYRMQHQFEHGIYS